MPRLPRERPGRTEAGRFDRSWLLAHRRLRIEADQGAVPAYAVAGADVESGSGAAVCGLIVNGFLIPGRHDTHIATALEAIPGALIGIGLMYLEGIRHRA